MSVIATEIQSDHHEAKSQPAEEKRRRRRTPISWTATAGPIYSI